MQRRHIWLAAGVLPVVAIVGYHALNRRVETKPDTEAATVHHAQTVRSSADPVNPAIPGKVDDAPRETKSGLPMDSDEPIQAFHRWADAAAASGFSSVDKTEGMNLAKARAESMKTLIQTDPAAALRKSLPAELRAALPREIAAVIEQPVKTTGTVSMRMMCNHSPDVPHGNCEAIPVLLEEIHSWDAHYGEQQWQSHLGKTVGFDGIAVDEELAVRSITPVSQK